MWVYAAPEGACQVDPSITTTELFARWREAERALVDLPRNSAVWKAGRFLADQAWQDYETRLDEERAAPRDEDGPT
jgi:hypothetical protein